VAVVVGIVAMPMPMAVRAVAASRTFVVVLFVRRKGEGVLRRLRGVVTVPVRAVPVRPGMRVPVRRRRRFRR